MIMASTGHFATLHAVRARPPALIRSPTASVTGPLTISPRATTASSTSVIAARPICNGRSFQTGRPSVHPVDGVGGPGERADETRRGPQRAEQAEAQQQLGVALLEHHRADHPDHAVLVVAEHRPGAHLIGQVDDGVDGLLAVGDQTDQGHHHDGGRKERQHPVVGQRGGPVGAVVVDEVLHAADQHPAPGPPAQLPHPAGTLRVPCAPSSVVPGSVVVMPAPCAPATG